MRRGPTDQLHNDSFAAALRMTKKLYDAGIPMVAGTDGVEGLMLHRELEIWVKAGIPPEKVLQAATLGAARVVKADAELGSIEEGKKADVVLVAGDPLRNISDIRRPAIVIKNGVVYKSQELYDTLGDRTVRWASGCVVGGVRQSWIAANCLDWWHEPILTG